MQSLPTPTGDDWEGLPWISQVIAGIVSGLALVFSLFRRRGNGKEKQVVSAVQPPPAGNGETLRNYQARDARQLDELRQKIEDLHDEIRRLTVELERIRAQRDIARAIMRNRNIDIPSDP